MTKIAVLSTIPLRIMFFGFFRLFPALLDLFFMRGVERKHFQGVGRVLKVKSVPILPAIKSKRSNLPKSCMCLVINHGSSKEYFLSLEQGFVAYLF